MMDHASCLMRNNIRYYYLYLPYHTVVVQDQQKVTSNNDMNTDMDMDMDHSKATTTTTTTTMVLLLTIFISHPLSTRKILQKDLLCRFGGSSIPYGERYSVQCDV